MKQKCFPIMLLILFVVVSVMVTGCSSGSPGMTKEDVHRRHIDSFQNSMWQFQDDIDAFMMIDQPGRQSPMYVR